MAYFIASAALNALTLQLTLHYLYYLWTAPLLFPLYLQPDYLISLYLAAA